MPRFGQTPTRSIRIPVPSVKYLVQRRKGLKSEASLIALRENDSQVIKASMFRRVNEQVLASKSGHLRCFTMSSKLVILNFKIVPCHLAKVS